MDGLCWCSRKTCHSCKCPREAHDVYHEEWVNVRERLGFRPDPERRGSKEKSQAEGYSWVPPGLPSHKVSDTGAAGYSYPSTPGTHRRVVPRCVSVPYVYHIIPKGAAQNSGIRDVNPLVILLRWGCKSAQVFVTPV